MDSSTGGLVRQPLAQLQRLAREAALLRQPGAPGQPLGRLRQRRELGRRVRQPAAAPRRRPPAARGRAPAPRGPPAAPGARPARRRPRVLGLLVQRQQVLHRRQAARRHPPGRCSKASRARACSREREQQLAALAARRATRAWPCPSSPSMSCGQGVLGVLAAALGRAPARGARAGRPCGAPASPRPATPSASSAPPRAARGRARALPRRAPPAASPGRAAAA